MELFPMFDRKTRVGLLLLTSAPVFNLSVVTARLGADLALFMLLIAVLAGLVAVAPFLVSMWREALADLRR